MLSCLIPVLAALAVIVAAYAGTPGGRILAAVTWIVFAVALIIWFYRCRLSTCRRLTVLAIGAGIGAAILGALMLLGTLSLAAGPVLILGALAAGTLAALAAACACVRGKGGGSCSCG